MKNSFSYSQKSVSMKNLISQYPRQKKRLYHWSSKDIDKLLPPNVTWNIRDWEEDRTAFRDVIFLTDNFEKAKEYAGNQWVIYFVDAYAAQYKEIAADVLNKKKLKTVNDDIFIALPEDIQIVSKWNKTPRKTNEIQKYVSQYVKKHIETSKA